MYLNWCINDPNAHIRIFRKRWSLILGYFFPVTIVNKYKKQIRKINLYFFFWRHFSTFFLQKFVIFVMIIYYFLVDKWGNIRTYKELCLQKSHNIYIVRIAFVLAFFKLLINEKSFGKSFAFPLSAKCVDRNFKCLF